jgi:Cu/Ag efflux protein CusF
MTNEEMYSTKMSWKAMRYRCKGHDVSHKHYKSYTEKGITVCDEWLDFNVFLSDMGIRPEGLTLDRKDNSLGYYKENCRWATAVEQANNTDRNVYITYHDETLTQIQWARKFGIKIQTISTRLKKGWKLDRVFEKVKENKLITYNGKTQTVRKWSIEIGISNKTIANRLKKGLTVEQALSKTRDGRRIKCFGKEKTITAWSEEYNINYDELSRRLRRGWTIERAILGYIPTQEKIEFISKQLSEGQG